MSIAVASYPKMPEMPYAEARPLIRSGDILFCSGSHILSKMIQKGTQSVWSHVGFILRCDDIDRVMLLESVESAGVRTVPLSHYDHNYKGGGQPYPGRVYIARHREFEKRVNYQRLHVMTQFAVDLFGYPYDRDEILRIAARIGMGLFGFSKKDVKRDREYICSEYAWECFKTVGIRIPYNPKGFIAPADFARDKHMKGIARIV